MVITLIVSRFSEENRLDKYLLSGVRAFSGVLSIIVLAVFVPEVAGQATCSLGSGSAKGFVDTIERQVVEDSAVKEGVPLLNS